MEKVFILDAYALIFRAYYAFIRNPRVTSGGLDTSAIYGFVNTLIDVISREKPERMAVAFDPAGPTFRKEIYTEYKANREATPEAIKTAVPYIKQILEALRIPVFEVANYEADDVAGSLAFDLNRKGYKVYMMTSDKDYCQLVNPDILIYKPAKGGNEAQIWGPEQVKKEFQVSEPRHVIDVLALWGDASDNVPGAPGIGEKTAKDLISKYENLENLYHNIEKLTERQKKSLLENKEQVMRARKLVTIETAIPLSYNPDDMKLTEPDETVLTKIFDELEFRSITKRLIAAMAHQGILTSVPPLTQMSAVPDLFSAPVAVPENKPEHNYLTFSADRVNYKLVQNNEINELIQVLENSPEFCFDTETTGLNPVSDELVGISFSVKKHEAYFVSFPQNQMEAVRMASQFKALFANESIGKCGQNMKFDIQVLRKYGIEVKGKFFDTMIAHYLLDPEQPHNMDHLSRVFLNYLPIPIEELIGKKGRSQMTMRLVDMQRLKDYACEDADVTWQLKEILSEKIKAEGLEKVFEDIEMPLVSVLADMEFNGVKLDISTLREQSKLLKEELRNSEKEIFGLSGTTFNMNSPKQLGDILFVKLKIIDNPKLTKTKQFSTNEETLQKLAGKHPIIDKILEYRMLQKLVSTYVDPLPEQVNPITKRLHTSFNQAVTSTGRLSSTSPNLQNIPIRDVKGREIRKAFVASSPEHVFVSADYSQIELRLMAHLSKDPIMIEAFRNNEDIHRTTAAKVFKVADTEVTREQRSKAKTANFGIIYGISAFGLSERMNITRTDAKQIIDSYFETFPGVKDYMNHCILTAREKSEVYTLTGRKRKLADINSQNSVVRGNAERNAINAPIQGTAADIIKIAMVNIHREFAKNAMKSKMLLQVHDELNFDVPRQELEKAMSIIKNEMENAMNLSVPLTVEIGTGSNWFEAH
jgi:DNA polymerase-1